MNKQVIVALDFPNCQSVETFLAQFPEPIYVKIGMELFYSEGIEIVKKIKSMGHAIFLDLKLHDIPNTVKGGMQSLANLGVDMVNVHAAGGIEMMKAAMEGLKAGSTGSIPKCIAVTQLTSTSQTMMETELLIEKPLARVVEIYAQNAKKAGLDGVVCSVHEAQSVHNTCGSNFFTVTPGIRLASDDEDDQKRVATPSYAKEQGCDFIVVGRSITKSDHPYQTYLKIIKEMEGK